MRPNPPIASGPVSAWRPPPQLDEYHIVRRLGRGGMGEVYLAHDEILDRPVAIKVISGIEPDPAARERFMLEARAAARLSHPNVLTVYRVGELESRPYLITEYIEGKTLDEIERPMPSKRVLELGVSLSRGLAAAHRRGVLHRDIKPSNAILTNEGEVKLLDFGLAKLLDGAAPPTRRSAAPPRSLEPAQQGGGTLVSIGTGETAAISSDGRSPLTDAGSLMGTPDYMAPEIWRGEPATRRSDVYALGALLFELCAGRPPNRDLPARTMPQLMQNREVPVLTEVVPQVSAKLSAIIERCLRRDPSERYASGDELREALEHVLRSERSGAIPDGNPYRGLHAFEAEHRALFFGRRAEIGTLLERLRVEPLVIVAGDSGVGKSSLCRAGVLPAVQDAAIGGGRTWSVLRFVPGRSPVLSLAAVVSPLLGLDDSAVVRRLRAHPSTLARAIKKRLGDTGGLVLFVDQMEELVTMADPTGAALVAEALGHLTMDLPAVRVLATVRSDFLAPVAALPGVGDEIARALYFLKPLSPEGIREAIIGPARATGVHFENEALVDTLVTSTSSAEGGLPLLQFALAELWEARDVEANAITAAALEKIGGVTGALARHADEVILGMTAVQRWAARRVLFMLVSQAGTPVRRREEELVAGDADARAALNGLVRGRLLVVRDAEHGATYELAHEALLRGWATLRRWLDEKAGSRAVQGRLSAAAMEWERLGRTKDVLWGARQLAELDEVIDAGDLSPRETAFVAASRTRQRRGKHLRTAAAMLVPAAFFGVRGVVQDHARREVTHRVEQLAQEAENKFQIARRENDRYEALRHEAFAHFDAFEREAGEATWTQALALGDLADREYGEAGQALETTLMVDASNAEVQRMLGDALYSRALLAEHRHHLSQRDELLQRLKLYDTDGSRRQRWVQPAEVDITSDPPGASVAVARYVEDDHKLFRLTPIGDRGETPLKNVTLAPGSYVLTLSLPGRATTTYPLLLGRAERLLLKVALPAASRVPSEFAYVAAGRFLFGSAAEEEARRAFYNAPPLHESTTGAFLIARNETTYADWLTFLQTLPPDERARRAPHVEGLTGALELKEIGDGWQLSIQPTKRVYTARLGERIHYEGRAQRAVQDWLRFPVSGVSPEDAAAYVRWLDKSGRVPGARLCSEREWERAARGADEREYPHGNRLDADDADIDQTYGKQPLAFGPDEVGSHPVSRSPFGVDDMCGNVFEWTSSSLSPEGFVLRGGGYYYDSTTARIPNRQTPEPTIHDANLGIRVCVTFEP